MNHEQMIQKVAEALAAWWHDPACVDGQEARIAVEALEQAGAFDDDYPYAELVQRAERAEANEAQFKKWKNEWETRARRAEAEVERLREQSARQAERWQNLYDSLTAERALADQLAEALGDYDRSGLWPEALEALAAWEEARRQ